jgi:hypothetical protein
MKIVKLPLLLLLFTIFNLENAHAEGDDDISVYSEGYETCALPIAENKPKFINNAETAIVIPLKDSSLPKCRSSNRPPEELYGLWIKSNPNLTSDNLDPQKLDPQLTEEERKWYLKYSIMSKANNDEKAKPNGDPKIWAPCFIEVFKNPESEFVDHKKCEPFKEILEGIKNQLITSKNYETGLAQGIFIQGEKISNKINAESAAHKGDGKSSGGSVSGESATGGSTESTTILTAGGANVTTTVATEGEAKGTTTGAAAGGATVTTAVVTAGEAKGTTSGAASGGAITDEVDEKNKKVATPVKTKNECEEKLSSEISALLNDKSKNIIGLQYELTVLKMASLSVSEGEKTFEGLIKKKSKDLKAIDDGSIDKMNQLYKKHGLSEDAKKITEAIKLKATDTNYYNKQKRFFNNDSSAFLMAYQHMNPSSVIKESDISVLWFMDKVSEKAKKQNKEYSSAHNRTNLSTRIAQYTGAIDPKKSLGQPKLDEMAKKQKEKIDNEFLAMIEKFKKNNAECFNELFGAAPEDLECNLTKVEDVFGNLLAVNSKISSTDLVDLDGKLSGKINQASFSIARYVDSPAVIPVKVEEQKEKVAPVVETKEEVKKEEVKVDEG